MNKLTSLLLGMIFSLSCVAQTNNLSFNSNHNFKIAQFTDMHLCLGDAKGQKQAKKTFERLEQAINNEKPDLIIFTGDIVTGEPSLEAWTQLLDKVNALNVPFGVVLGNHDPEVAKRPDIAALIVKYKDCVNQLNSSGELADVILPIRSLDNANDKAFIYLMDSNDYSPIKGVEGYGWFSRNQIDWFVETSKTVNPTKQPALAFFHIPLPEYTTAWNQKKNVRIGRCAEDPCPPSINTGMFAAMVECGDVIGTFVGHDHDNDYIVLDQGIALGYGRFSGENTTYNNLRSGVRIIEMQEDINGYITWIIEDDGRVVDKVQVVDKTIKK